MLSVKQTFCCMLLPVRFTNIPVDIILPNKSATLSDFVQIVQVVQETAINRIMSFVVSRKLNSHIAQTQRWREREREDMSAHKRCNFLVNSLVRIPQRHSGLLLPEYFQYSAILSVLFRETEI